MKKLLEILSEYDEFGVIKIFFDLFKYARELENYEDAYDELVNSYKSNIGKDNLYNIINLDSKIRNNLKEYLGITNYSEFEVTLKDYFFNKVKNKYKYSKLMNTDENNKKITCFIWFAINIFKKTKGYSIQATKLEENYNLVINLPGKVDTLQKCMQNFVNNKHFQLENILSLEDIKSLTQKAYDENIKNIDLIYKNFKNAIGDTSINSYSFEIAEVGYIISDIYERNGEFQKSVDISRHIIPIYKKRCEEIFKDNESNYNHYCISNIDILRRLIGCIYSLAIANVKEKKELLDIAEIEFNTINNYIETLENNRIIYSKSDRFFIKGLYYSNYGAFLLAKGKFNEKNESYDIAHKLYLEAKEIHIKGLNQKNISRENMEDDDSKINELNVMIAKSNRNIATSYYYLKDYKESIKYHKIAIDELKKSEDKQQLYQTFDCITGTYIKYWENNNLNLNLEDFKDCCFYLQKTIDYYYSNHPRYKNAIKRKDVLINIIGSISDSIIYEKAEQFYDDIFSRL